MGLLSNLFSPLVSWWRMVWYTPERDMPPLLPEQPVSVINMPSAPAAPRVEPPAAPRRVLEFRGWQWVEEREEGKQNELVRFSREIAVNGRAVKSELTVLKADLTRKDNGHYTLNGRD